AIAIMGLNILVGYSGQLSLGHGAFMALGAYTSAILAHHYKLDYLITIPIAALLTGLVGFLFGIPSLRLSALYLALATFALAVVTPSLIKRPAALTGGVQGILVLQPDPPQFAQDVFAFVTGTRMSSDQWIYYLSLFCALHPAACRCRCRGPGIDSGTTAGRHLCLLPADRVEPVGAQPGLDSRPDQIDREERGPGRLLRRGPDPDHDVCAQRHRRPRQL